MCCGHVPTYGPLFPLRYLGRQALEKRAALAGQGDELVGHLVERGLCVLGDQLAVALANSIMAGLSPLNLVVIIDRGLGGSG